MPINDNAYVKNVISMMIIIIFSTEITPLPLKFSKDLTHFVWLYLFLLFVGEEFVEIVFILFYV